MQQVTQSGDRVEESVCPICSCDTIDRQVDDCPPICTGCGYVIRPAASTDQPLQLENIATDQSGPAAASTWAEAYHVENATQQRLAHAFEQLEAIGARINIPAELRKAAAEIYCEAFKQGVTDGRNTAVMVSVCLRVASLKKEMPIPVAVLVNFETVDRTAFSSCYSAVEAELEHELLPPSPIDYLHYLAIILALDQRPRAAAQRDLEEVSGEPSFTGKDPAGIAAAAVYIAAEDLTQADVSEAAGVSTETIRQRVAELREVSTDA